MKNFLIYLVKKAGNIILDYYNKKISISYKSKFNPVTKADKESEEIIKNEITKKFPNDEFICEESCSNIDVRDKNKRYWIIDPIDGTVNFTHKLPIFCISIGVMENLQIVYGIVYNPVTKDIYFAQKNKGAFKNSKKMSVSNISQFDKALLVTGFPYYSYKNPKNLFKLFNAFVIKSQAVRRLGSAALDICFVAEGIFEGFWEENLQAWDVAAASLILEESGGVVTDYFGKKNHLFGKTIVASNGKIHKKMLKIIKETIK